MDPLRHEQEKIERLRRAMYSRSLSQKLKERPRREMEADDAPMAEDFAEREELVAGITVAPRFIGAARKILWWILGLAVVFFVGATGFFGYYFTLGGGSVAASPSNIDISVLGPSQVQGGTPTELQIVVVNRNNIPLQLADLVVTFPSGTRSVTDYTTDLPSLRESLGTIEPGGQRQGTVSAVFSGKSGDHADVKVEVQYRINGSNAIFVASSNYTMLFSSSPLSLSVGGNTETISGQPVQLTVSVASNTNAPVRDVLLGADYPFGFKLSSATPAPSANGLWELGDLAPGQTSAVVIRGTLSGAEGDERVFRFEAGTRSASSSDSITTSLADNSFSVGITKPFLGLSISTNGASSSPIVVSPGDAVNVSIAWQNNLPVAITGAVIAAQLNGVQIDGSTVRSADGFYRSADAVMLWDKTTDPALADLAPGARGTVAFSFQMPNSADLRHAVNPQVDISINAAGNRVSETSVPENLQATAEQKIELTSDLELTAQGLYYSNPFGSTGPMPPKADTETTYAIILTVTNTTNKLSGASVTARLPSYVRWIGAYRPSFEQVTFDQNDGSLTWRLGDVEPGAGLNGSAPRQIAIAIGFTPSASQIGQQPPLLQDISFSGSDAATGASIEKKAGDVTTNIAGDPGFSSANAQVVK